MGHHTYSIHRQVCICHGVCCYHVVCVLCLQGPSQLHSLLWIGLTMTEVFFRTTTFSCKQPTTPWWAFQKLLLSSRWVCHKLHSPPHTVQRRCCFWCVLQVLDKQYAKPNCSHFPWVRVFHCHRAHAACWTVLADHAGTHQIVQSNTNMLYTIYSILCTAAHAICSFLSFLLSCSPVHLSLLSLSLHVGRCLTCPQRPTSVTRVASPIMLE